jgi:hypothetical protein
MRPGFTTRLVLIAALLLPLLARTAAAMSCIPATLQQHADRADAIATARMVALPEWDTSAAYRPVVFETLRVYKGQLGPQIVVMQPTLMGDLRLLSGRSYLLFLGKRFDGSRDTTICHGSRLLDGTLTPEEAAILGAGYDPAGPSDPIPQRSSDPVRPPAEPPANPGSRSPVGGEARAPAALLGVLAVLGGGGLLLWLRWRRA